MAYPGDSADKGPVDKRCEAGGGHQGIFSWQRVRSTRPMDRGARLGPELGNRFGVLGPWHLQGSFKGSDGGDAAKRRTWASWSRDMPHLTSIHDLTDERIHALLDRAAAIEADPAAVRHLLDGRIVCTA